MADPTQQDLRAPSEEPATNEQPGVPPPGPVSADSMPVASSATGGASTLGAGTLHGDHDADIDDDDDLDDDDGIIDQAMKEAMIENLLARVVSVRQQWAALERERYVLRRALRRVERERDESRAEHERALRRAEAAELRLADVQARIAALEDSLQQRRRGRGGSAKPAGPGHDVGQDLE